MYPPARRQIVFCVNTSEEKANLIHSLPSAAFRRTPLRFVRLHFASLSSLISFSFSGKAIKLTMHTAVFTQSLSLRSLLHSFVSHSLHLFTPFRSLASYSCHGDAFWSVVLQPFSNLKDGSLQKENQISFTHFLPFYYAVLRFAAYNSIPLQSVRSFHLAFLGSV